MGFKTITIKERTYNKLLLMKRKDESFSDLFDRLIDSNMKILEKMRASQTYKDKQEMLHEITRKRKEKRYG